MRRPLIVILAAASLLAACGGDDDAATATATDQPAAVDPTEAPAAVDPTEAPAVVDPTEAPAVVDPTEAPAVVDPTEAPAVVDPTEAPTDVPTTGAADQVDVGLIEWGIDAPTTIDAGTIEFTIANMGRNPHEFKVTKGTRYEDLPLAANGAIIEEELPPGDLIGGTEVFDGGVTETITLDLEPGNYVFFCNISIGPNSHAARGQVLSVEVVG